MIHVHPENGNCIGEYFWMEYWETVCKLRRRTQVFAPIRITGFQYPGPAIHMHYDYGPDRNKGFHVKYTDIISLVPVVSEMKGKA